MVNKLDEINSSTGFSLADNEGIPIKDVSLKDKDIVEIVDKIAKKDFKNVYVREKVHKDGRKELKVSVINNKKIITHLFNEFVNFGKKILGYATTHYDLFSKLEHNKREEIVSYIIQTYLERELKDFMTKPERQYFREEGELKVIPEDYAVQIAKDIHRTAEGQYPPGMTKEQYEKKLQRILHFGVTKVPPEIGYCQGMNFIADIALHFFPDDECMAAAFYCRVIQVNPTRFIGKGMKLDQEKLKDILSKSFDDEDTRLYSKVAIEALSMSYFVKRDQKETALKIAHVLFTQGDEGYWKLVERVVEKAKKENLITGTELPDDLKKIYSELMVECVRDIKIKK